MTIHDGAPSEPSGPSSPQPSADLVAVPRFRVAPLPLHVRADLAEARRALADRRPAEGDLGTALAETICSIAFLGSVEQPEPRERGADYFWVQQVDGHLRTFVFQAKWAPYGAERARARLGVFAALNARQAILETRTVDGWKPAVAEFARMWLDIPNPTRSGWKRSRRPCWGTGWTCWTSTSSTTPATSA